MGNAPILIKGGREDQQQGRHLLPHPLAINDTHTSTCQGRETKSNQVGIELNGNPRLNQQASQYPSAGAPEFPPICETEKKINPPQHVCTHTHAKKKGFSWEK